MSNPFRHIQVSTDSNHLVITPIDQYVRGDALSDALREEIDRVLGPANSVILDMQHVHTISSSGLRPILHLRREMHRRGGIFRICGLRPYVLDLLRVVRLSREPIEVQADVAAAIASMPSSSNTCEGMSP